MHRKPFHSHRGQPLIQVLTKSLLISLLALSSTAAWAQKQEIETPTPNSEETELPTTEKPVVPTKPETKNPETENPVAKKLLGTWEAKNPANPSSSETVKFIFASAGRMYIVMSSSSNNPVGYETSYKIDSKKKPMHLDVVLAGRNEKVLTIFEFVDDDKMKVEVEKSRPGRPRPKNFPVNTPVFEKVSLSTNVPKNVKLLGSGSQGSSVENENIQDKKSLKSSGEASNTNKSR